MMCSYSEIEDVTLSEGKTVRAVNEAVRKEVERIYVEGWKIGIAIPFRDGNGNICLANPDGSEDIVEFNSGERNYKVISRTANAGQGRFAYLLNKV